MIADILKRKVINLDTIGNTHIDKFIMVDYQETACKVMSRLMDQNISSIL